MADATDVTMHDGPEEIATGARARTGQPVLTIGIPAYKHADFIEECLSGIVSAGLEEDLELIVVDDCSPDATLEIAVRTLTSAALRYRIFRNARNRGLTYGLRFLLHAAQGRFFLCCASDDYVDPSALVSVIRDLADSNCHLPAFRIYAAEYVGDRQGPVYDAAHLLGMASDTRRFLHWLSTEFPRPLLLQSTVFRTEFLRKVDPWSEGLILDDWPTFLRSVQLADQEGLPVSFRPDIVLTAYRVHGGGVHANLHRQSRALLEVVEKVIPDVHRGEAEAFVKSAIATSTIAQGRYLEGLRLYREALIAHPAPRTLAHVPTAVVRGMLRRVFKRR